MKRLPVRRGSALLIVLGMLAFMVVSAVSFAVYMRQSRAPSSYLRRSSSSRLLLKGALAQAIACLEGQYNVDEGRAEGIYDDFYPGLNGCAEEDDNVEQNGDYWNHRVFTPFGLVSAGSTVSTLTLEALAYLPPAILNEVRVYARQSRTAEWMNLPYDMGRYAFTAVDVSDCFDINKVRANRRRSSATNERITLAPLYAGYEKSLDQALTKASTAGGANYFLSLADYNLLLGRSSDYAPFMQFVGKTDEAIYLSNKTTQHTISNALFITDTWFPPTNGTVTANLFNLEGAESRNQPFTESQLARKRMDILTVGTGNTLLGKVMLANLGGIGLACLKDYLDADNMPTSLCIPTVETVPMVCGIGLCDAGAVLPKVVEGMKRFGKFDSGKTDPLDSSKKIMYNRYAEAITLKQFIKDNSLAITGTLAYPFRRTGATKDKEEGTKQDFTYEVLVKLFFAPSGFNCRVDKKSPLYPAGTWANSVANGIVTATGTARLSGGNLAKDCVAQEEAVVKFQSVIDIPAVDCPLFWYVHCTDDKGASLDKTPGYAPYYSLEGLRDADNALKPYSKEGVVETWWKTASVGSDNTYADWPTDVTGTWPRAPAAATLGTEKYVPHIAVWVRVLNAEGKTVDMVPARLSDDHYWADRQISTEDADDIAEGAGVFGKKTPILDFRGNVEFTYSYSDDTANPSANQQLTGDKANTFQWNVLYAPDPRYNWAPENWVWKKNTDGTAQKDEWLDLVTPLLGKNGRDQDIFLFTSDQNYLQSAGELAFLPLLEPLDGQAKMFEGDYPVAMRKGLSGPDIASQDAVNKLAAYDYFWMTYSPIEDNLYALPYDGQTYEIASGANDFRVNPFSPDARVLDAVFRETPFDYHVASINADCFADADKVPKTFREKYVLESKTGYAEAKIPEKFLPAIRQVFMDEMRALARTYYGKGKGKHLPSWETLYNDLDWFGSGTGDAQEDFLGVDLKQPLYGVDRKFLYSFWRECFQNRQQLFLVFLRAEPLTTGGMGKGSLAASQLGARGVALVWRDPLPPVKNRAERRRRGEMLSAANWRNQDAKSGPHRTRVLFYHQFE